MFTKSGYSASSVNEIAREVGITQTGVLHHFAGGKIALLRAVLEQRDVRAEDILAGAHGRDFLVGLVEISRTQASLRGAVQLYTILSAEATNPEHPAHEYFVGRFTRITDAVTVAFTEVQEAGGLREGVDARRAALDIVAATEGLELLWLYGVDVDMVADIRHRINGFLTSPL